MKAILFGDSHFGSGDGYGRYPGERLKDQQAALEAVVDLAIEHQVDLVGFCGDAFEGPQVTPEQYEAFRAPLRRLDIPVVGISGNGRHDAATRSVNALEVCSDVMDVHRVPALVEIAGVHIGLMPWTAGVSRLAAARDGGDRDELHDDAGALLVQVARDLYAQIPDGAPSLLLGHWSLSGAHLPNGLPVDELGEPVIETGDLEAVGFDLCVFGHIHVPGAIAETVLYTGPLLTHDFGEAGVEHGCWLVEFSADVFEGMEWTFLPIESRPFVTIDFDLTDETQARWLETAVEHPSMIDPALVNEAVVRFRYSATEEQARRIDHAEITRALLEAGASKVWQIEARVERASRARVEVAEDLTPLAAYALWAEANEVDPALAEAARARLAEHLEAIA